MTELLVVLSIIAIITGFGGSWLSSQIPAFRLNSAARMIRSDLLSARMLAVSQGNEFRILFRPPFRYVILDDHNNNGRQDENEPGESRDLRNDYPGVTFEANNSPIFHPRGIASNLATISLANAAGQKSITVSMTGRVKIVGGQ